MPAIEITVTGNLARDPDLRYTAEAPVASFTVASTERYQENGEWKDGTTSWVRCNAWRELAEHVVESFSKGDRVIVHGTLRQRDYEVPAKDGEPGREAHLMGGQRDRRGPVAEVRHRQGQEGGP